MLRWLGPTRRARIRGTLWWPGIDLSPDQATTEIGDQVGAGFDLLWLCGTQYLLADPRGADLLDAILVEADRCNLLVLFQTHTSSDWYSRWDLDQELEQNRMFVQDAWRKLGHHPSFGAWYIGHEIYIMWGEQGEYCRRLFRGIVDTVRRISPRCRVAISPFFILDRNRILGDFRFAEPAEYTTWWSETLTRTGIDWLMVQDSGEHVAFTSVAEKEPFIAAFAQACRTMGVEFWVNVETAEMNVPDYAALRVARTLPPDQQPWRTVPQVRLLEKLELAGRYTTSAVTWGWEYWRPALGEEALAYYRMFRRINTVNR